MSTELNTVTQEQNVSSIDYIAPNLAALKIGCLLGADTWGTISNLPCLVRLSHDMLDIVPLSKDLQCKMNSLLCSAIPVHTVLFTM